MGALLIHDTQNPDAPANPNSQRGKRLRNPMELFTHGSFHGGVWRCAYRIGDIGVPSVLAFYVGTKTLLLTAVTAGLAAGCQWLATGDALPALVRQFM